MDSYGLRLLLCLIFMISGVLADPDYEVQCLLEKVAVKPCVRAIFSKIEKFEFEGITHKIPDGGCSTPSDGHFHDKIGIVERGQCPFEQKAKVAESLKLKALIVVNLDDQPFPMSASDQNYASKIPILMVPQKASNLLKEGMKMTLKQTSAGKITIFSFALKLSYSIFISLKAKQ
jgi:hypothetical protein